MSPHRPIIPTISNINAFFLYSYPPSDIAFLCCVSEFRGIKVGRVIHWLYYRCIRGERDDINFLPCIKLSPIWSHSPHWNFSFTSIHLTHSVSPMYCILSKSVFKIILVFNRIKTIGFIQSLQPYPIHITLHLSIQHWYATLSYNSLRSVQLALIMFIQT